MKFFISAIICILLLAGCTGQSEAEATTAEHLAGTYVNKRPDGKNFLRLSRDGRGVIATRDSTGNFGMLMTFDWAVEGDNFHQTRVRWTSDGRESHLSHDSSTRYRFDGHAFESRSLVSGDWIRWEPTSEDVFKDVTEAVSAKFSRNDGG